MLHNFLQERTSCINFLASLRVSASASSGIDWSRPGTDRTGVEGDCGGETDVGGIGLGVRGSGPGMGWPMWWIVGCWSISSSTICASSSRSCWGCQSIFDSMTTVTHSLVSPMITLMGFSSPPLGLTTPEVMRFLMTFRSRFLRVVFPTRGGPVNKHLRDLCLIFCW